MSMRIIIYNLEETKEVISAGMLGWWLLLSSLCRYIREFIVWRRGTDTDVGHGYEHAYISFTSAAVNIIIDETGVAIDGNEHKL